MELKGKKSSDLIFSSQNSQAEYLNLSAENRNSSAAIIMSRRDMPKFRHSNKYFKKLIIFFLIACFILLILLCSAIALLLKSQKSLELIKNENRKTDLILQSKTDTKLKSECTTASCFKASKFILDNLNQSIAPCENFYQFTCGTWINDKTHEEKDHFTMAYEKMLDDISDILKSPIDPRVDLDLVSNFKLFYQSCVNQNSIEFASDFHFHEYMHTQLGPWPLVPYPNQGKTILYSNKSLFGFEEHLAQLTLLRMPILLRFESDDFNHSTILMKIVIPEDFCHLQNFFPNTTKSRAEFKKMLKNIRNYMFETFQMTDSSNETSLDEQINEMLALASQIFFLNNNDYRCGKKSNKQISRYMKTINELHKLLNQNASSEMLVFDFKRFISYLNADASKKLTDDTQVIISSLGLNYLKDLFKGLAELNFTTEQFQRAFSNLIYFHSIYDLIKPLRIFSTAHIHVIFPIRYYHALFEYSKHVNKITPVDNFEMIYRINREQNCAYSVRDAFSIVDSDEQNELQRVFLTRKFNRNNKNKSNQILERLIKTSIDIVQKQDWIDMATKQRVLKQMAHMEHKIVYSDLIFEQNSGENNKPQKYNLTQSYLINKLILRKSPMLGSLIYSAWNKPPGYEIKNTYLIYFWLI